MNNFEFTEDGQVTVHRQYRIGTGKVTIIERKRISLPIISDVRDEK